MKTCFVVLHFLALDSTLECISSIQNLYSSNDIEIVIVDNHSPDGSGQVLSEKYSGNKHVHVILNDENAGFAKGNNLGFKYCKEQFSPDFMVFCNNDIIFYQKEFLDNIDRIYRSEKFDILGPDIVNPEGRHQNPMYENQIPLKLLKKVYLKCHVKIFILKSGKLLKKFYKAYNKVYSKYNPPPVVDRQVNQYTCVLSGSCMIFSGKYCESHDYAFYPETFMYFEESILRYLIDREKGIMMYSPEVEVLHKHGESTSALHRESIDHEIFVRQQYIRSLKVAIRLMSGR